jgi:hypothetical protein
LLCHRMATQHFLLLLPDLSRPVDAVILPAPLYFIGLRAANLYTRPSSRTPYSAVTPCCLYRTHHRCPYGALLTAGEGPAYMTTLSCREPKVVHTDPALG